MFGNFNHHQLYILHIIRSFSLPNLYFIWLLLYRLHFLVLLHLNGFKTFLSDDIALFKMCLKIKRLLIWLQKLSYLQLKIK